MTKFQAYFLLVFLSIGVVACNSDNKEKSNDEGLTMSLITLQTSCVDEYNNSHSTTYSLKDVAQDKSNLTTAAKAQRVNQSIKKIDEEAAKLISQIEAAKKSLFKELGENINPMNKNSIVARKYTDREPLLIGSYALFEVKSTSTSNLLDYSGTTSKKLIEGIRSFRTVLCEEFVASNSTNGESPYFFQDPKINQHKDYLDLRDQLSKALNKSNIHYDDFEMLKLLYGKLSFSDYHWQSVLQSNSNWLSIFGVLTSMEYTVLEARTNAIECMAARFNLGSDFIVSSLEPIVFGPEIAYEGEMVQMEVALGGYDQYNAPVLTVNGGTITEIKNGKGYVVAKAQEGATEMSLSGTISIHTRSGEVKFYPWQKTIVILKHDDAYYKVHGPKKK